MFSGPYSLVVRLPGVLPFAMDRVVDQSPLQPVLVEHAWLVQLPRASSSVSHNFWYLARIPLLQQITQDTASQAPNRRFKVRGSRDHWLPS